MGCNVRGGVTLRSTPGLVCRTFSVSFIRVEIAGPNSTRDGPVWQSKLPGQIRVKIFPAEMVAVGLASAIDVLSISPQSRRRIGEDRLPGNPWMTEHLCNSKALFGRPLQCTFQKVIHALSLVRGYLLILQLQYRHFLTFDSKMVSGARYMTGIPMFSGPGGRPKGKASPKSTSSTSCVRYLALGMPAGSTTYRGAESPMFSPGAATSFSVLVVPSRCSTSSSVQSSTGLNFSSTFGKVRSMVVLSSHDLFIDACVPTTVTDLLRM